MGETRKRVVKGWAEWQSPGIRMSNEEVINIQQKVRRLQGVSTCSVNFNALLQRSYSL